MSFSDRLCQKLPFITPVSSTHLLCKQDLDLRAWQALEMCLVKWRKPCPSLNFVLPIEVKDALVGFIALYSCICLISGWLLINICVQSAI